MLKVKPVEILSLTYSNLWVYQKRRKYTQVTSSKILFKWKPIEMKEKFMWRNFCEFFVVVFDNRQSHSFTQLSNQKENENDTTNSFVSTFESTFTIIIL